MNIKKCLYVIVVIILIKLEVVGPNNNSISCSCWGEFVQCVVIAERGLF